MPKRIHCKNPYCEGYPNRPSKHTATIRLTNSPLRALVWKEHYEFLSKFTWNQTSLGYAITSPVEENGENAGLYMWDLFTRWQEGKINLPSVAIN